MLYIFVAPLFGACIFINVISSCWIDPLSLCDAHFVFYTVFVLKSIVSDMSIARPVLLSFLFAWNYFLHPFTYSLCVSLLLKLVSCGQHKIVSCFLIHSPTLCLLIGEFSPFTFEIIIDRYALIAVLLIVFCVFFIVPLCSFLLLVLFLCGLMTFFSVKFRFLSLFLLCIYYEFSLCSYCEIHI